MKREYMKFNWLTLKPIDEEEQYYYGQLFTKEYLLRKKKFGKQLMDVPRELTDANLPLARQALNLTPDVNYAQAFRIWGYVVASLESYKLVKIFRNIVLFHVIFLIILLTLIII